MRSGGEGGAALTSRRLASAVERALGALTRHHPRLAFAGDALDLEHMGALHAAASSGAAAAERTARVLDTLGLGLNAPQGALGPL